MTNKFSTPKNLYSEDPPLANHFLFPEVENYNYPLYDQYSTSMSMTTNSNSNTAQSIPANYPNNNAIMNNSNIDSMQQQTTQRRQSMPAQSTNNQSQPQQPTQSKPYSRTRSRSVIEQSHSISKCGQPQIDFLIGGTKFTVHKKYKLLRAIGHGAYGFVCSAENTQTNEYVAIKKITNLFNNPIETKRAIREVQLLRKLRHENILGLTDLMMNDARTDLYLVSELMDSDLHHIIVSKQQLSNDHIQYFIYQILRGLLFIHSANVIHRDLKPSNILVNSNCDIKICDFGLARPVDAQVQDHKAFMTEYVATRWYRAPEIMLSWKQYSFAIDIWATGCILAELLGRMPLFPGKDYMDQLKRTLNYIGKPQIDEISHIHTERAKAWVRNFPPTPRVDWRHLYPSADIKSIDLLDKMLQFSPSKRITVQQALKHKYLEQLHDSSDEPIANFKFDMSFEQEFKDNTVEISKTKAVLERELNWFREFQYQRTNYLLHVKNRKSSTASSTNSNSNHNSHTNTPSQSQSRSNSNSNSMHSTPSQQPSHPNPNTNPNPSNYGMQQQQQQRMNDFQAHIMQQQMLQAQQTQNLMAQQQQIMRNRSQSYPLMPNQGFVNNHAPSNHNPNPVPNQQVNQNINYMQQQQNNINMQYFQHQQYLQQQQMQQNLNNMGFNGHQQNMMNVNSNINNNQPIMNRSDHSQSMHLD